MTRSRRISANGEAASPCARIFIPPCSTSAGIEWRSCPPLYHVKRRTKEAQTVRPSRRTTTLEFHPSPVNARTVLQRRRKRESEGGWGRAENWRFCRAQLLYPTLPRLRTIHGSVAALCCPTPHILSSGQDIAPPPATSLGCRNQHLLIPLHKNATATSSSLPCRAV